MNNFLATDGISIHPLSEETLSGAIDCVSESFSKNEPMARYLGITTEEFKVFAEAFYPPLISSNLSFVALDEVTNNIVGVRISEDAYSKEIDLVIPKLSPKFDPLFSLLDSLGSIFRSIRTIQPNQYAHMYMIAVNPKYSGKGIALAMNKVFFAHIKKKGFTHAVTEPTGLISQHILKNRFGFKVLHEIKYTDFTLHGKKPFEGIINNPCAMLMEKRLSELNI